MGLESRIPEITAQIPPHVHAAIIGGAELVTQDAKQRVPVETGRLRDSIHIDDEPEGVYVVAGNRRIFYGNLVEHGHAQQGGGQVAPHPFLVPALEDNREEIENIVAESLRRASA